MEYFDLNALIALFTSRLDTLGHLLRRAEAHFEGDHSFLEHRVAPDMHPLQTQVVCVCDQPRNFVLWLEGGKAALNRGPEVASLEQALGQVEDTKALLRALGSSDARLPARARMDLGPGVHVDLSAHEYVNDFLIPNFYFHLVTAYAILRMAKLPIGKADYMLHMKGLVRNQMPV